MHSSENWRLQIGDSKLQHINPLTPEPPVQDSTALKNCSFLNRANIALTISFHNSLESTSNLDTQ